MAPAHPIHLVLLVFSGFVLVNSFTGLPACQLLQQLETSSSSLPDEFKQCFTMMEVNVENPSWKILNRKTPTQLMDLKNISDAICRNMDKIKLGINCVVNVLKQQCNDFMATASKAMNMDHLGDFLEYLCQHADEVYTQENMKCVVDAVTPEKARVCGENFVQQIKDVASDETKTTKEKEEAAVCLQWSLMYTCGHESYSQCSKAIENFSAEMVRLLQPSYCPALNSGVRMHAELTVFFVIASVLVWITCIP